MLCIEALLFVGVNGFEPSLSRPPDAHFNRTKLHPEMFTNSIANLLKIVSFMDQEIHINKVLNSKYLIFSLIGNEIIYLS